jgi:hypothetical protein
VLGTEIPDEKTVHCVTDQPPVHKIRVTLARAIGEPELDMDV